jgi:uncharacterized membrane protein YbhN (UPF0104 family)
MNINRYWNIKRLTASDFRGIDEAKFNEWKTLQIRMSREQRIVMFSALGIWFIYVALTEHRYLIGAAIVISFIAAYSVWFFLRTKRLRELRKELKMFDRIWAKRKGRAFTE